MDDNTLLERRTIRPSRRKVLLVGIGCLVFTVAGIWMVATGDASTKLWGGIGAVFFGGGGALWAWALRNGRVGLTIDRDGLHFAPGLSGVEALAPWTDIEGFTVVRHSGQDFVGVVLSRYDGYLASIPEDKAEHMVRWLRRSRWLGYPTAALAVTQLKNPIPLARAMHGVGASRTLADMLALSRRLFGADILIPGSQLDRSAAAFADHLEACRRAAVGRPPGPGE